MEIKNKRKMNFKNSMILVLSTYLILNLVTFSFVYRTIDKLNDEFQTEAFNMATRYGKVVEIANYATSQTIDTLETRLEVALESLYLNKNELIDNKNDLSKYLETLKLANIYVYNQDGIIVNGSNAYFDGWRAPKTHDLYDVYGSSDTIVHKPLRKATEHDSYYKYAYMKLDDFGVIQISIQAEEIKDLIEKYHPMSIINEIISDEYVIESEVYFKDVDTLSNSFGIYNLSEENFKFNDNISTEINTSQEVLNNKKVLKINLPIEMENEVVGELVLYRSLTNYNNLFAYTKIFIILFFTIYMSVVLWLILNNFTNQKKLLTISYYDDETGLYSNNYLKRFIKENYEKLTTNKYSVVAVVFSNYDKLKLLMSEESFEKMIELIINKTLSVKSPSSIAFKISDDTLVFFNEASSDEKNFKSKLKSYLDRLNNLTYEDRKLDIKLGILNLDDKYLTPHQLNSNITNVIAQLRQESREDFFVFDDLVWEQLELNAKIHNELKRASIEGFKDEFYLVFQPIINTLENKVISFESLLRWNHPDLGHISPSVFIPIAESSKVINNLGKFVLEETIKFIKELDDEKIKVSMNISYPQFQEVGFVDNIISVLNKYGINPKQLGLEITESILISDYQLVNSKLIQLKNHGIAIYLDDFGVGYSSIERIKNIAIDHIKIDKSLVDVIDETPSLMEGVLKMLNSFEYDIVAEGVETKSQVDWLKNYDCVSIQGYYFSKPLIKEEALAYLKTFQAK